MSTVSCDELLVKVACGELLIADLNLESGGFYRVFGPSASGASEFLQLIAGLPGVLEQTRPAEGKRVLRQPIAIDTLRLRSLRFRGQPLFDLPSVERARQIGFIWEDPEASFLGSKVLEEYLYQPATLGISPLPSLWALKDYGLYEKRDQDIFTLSGGERHRLNVAAVLALSRELIVADFGSSNLDDDFEVELVQRLRDEASRGATVVVRGLEYREFESTGWVSVESGVVGTSVTPPIGFVPLTEQRRRLRAALNERRKGDVVLVLNGARPHYSPGSLTGEVCRGQVIVVKGHNGVGKTSLAKVLATAGSSLAAGSLRLADGARPMMSLQSVRHTFLRDRVDKELDDTNVLAAAGLGGQSARHPLALAPEDQKLLAVAAALSRAIGIAILDEPTCGLSFIAKERLVSLLNAFPDLAVLLITHDEALDELGTVMEMR
jgi:energy-coupling factor transporter ATP-binding protein EcfA2